MTPKFIRKSKHKKVVRKDLRKRKGGGPAPRKWLQGWSQAPGVAGGRRRSRGSHRPHKCAEREGSAYPPLGEGDPLVRGAAGESLREGMIRPVLHSAHTRQPKGARDIM